MRSVVVAPILVLAILGVGPAHMVNMEKPAEFNKILLDFLGTLRR